MTNPRRQCPIQWIRYIPHKHQHVRLIDLPIAVDISQANTAVVRHGNRRIGAGHRHEHRVFQTHLPIVIHIAQNVLCQRGATCQRCCIQDQLYRCHPLSHAERCIRVGRQAPARNNKTICPFCRVCGHRHRGRGRSRSRDPRLPIQKHHPLGLLPPTHRQPIEIHPSGYRLPHRIGRVPLRRVRTSWLFRVHQRRNMLSQHIKHIEPHMRNRRNLIGDHGRRVEGVGVIRS